jgi:hypothetical protein
MHSADSASQSPDPAAQARTNLLLQESHDIIYRRTDRMFAKLMFCLWLAGIAVAIGISAQAYFGVASPDGSSLWLAIFLGGALAALPIFHCWRRPGRALTRHVVAASQMLTVAFLIYLTGGLTESYFLIFGSMALLAFYRDWHLLVTATVVVAASQYLGSIFWPQSGLGAPAVSSWHWLEHADWLLFEDAFLLIMIWQSLVDMKDNAIRRAKLETLNTRIEAQVAERTTELAAAQKEAALETARFQFIFGSIPVGITWMLRGNPSTRLVNSAHSRITGVPLEQCHQLELYRVATHPEDRHKQDDLHEQLVAGKIDHYTIEKRYVHADGKVFWVSLTIRFFHDAATGQTQEICTLVDITERKEAEAQLEKVHKELMGASRQAGMAEVATSVLHNVGNVLNSVNVSVTLVADQVRNSKIANLTKVNALLRAHEADLASFLTNDAQGRQIRGYLVTLAEHLTTEQGAMLQELEALRKNMEHIKEIVAMQQNYSKVYGLAETLPVVDLVEDALRMNAGAFVRHDVSVVRDYASRPTVTLEKHKVLQILVNVMRNAKYACDESGRRDKQMKIAITNGHDRVRIVVADNGVGIPRENLSQIFAHGFTTRKDGHGFGLHSGALAAKELGGTLTAESDGPGRGATFTLDLPVKQEGVRHD